ncbi:hypothetical protein [Desulfovibrio gilichinskyi]|uniref:Uncharacterized protein n=1 Tax=Desulfovibrio gilichinskyi TaxID=1519643 RepID=A0A1X7C421_9BACT|nr:hypothetical protein [Desulfovibrio gilichinskyi]SME89430.1 hypothetical protein SAMN06295933_0300 [Desulfovibrio gilichinskyi]
MSMGHGVGSEGQGLGGRSSGSKSTSVNGRKGGSYNNVGGSNGIGGEGPSYREGPDRTGPNGKPQTWTAVDGWHDVSTRAGTPSYNGGFMATAWGARHPGQYARELGQFHHEQRMARQNKQADVIAGKLGELTDRVNKGLTDPTDYMSQHKSIVTGDLESLRGLGYNTDDMEKSFSPSGFMDTISSWMGGKPDKVKTYAGVIQDQIDQGLMEYDKDKGLVYTNKGGWVNVAKGFSIMPGMGYAPSVIDAGFDLANLDFGNLKTKVDAPYTRAGATAQPFAALAAPSIGLNLAKAIYNAAPAVGGMMDVYSTAVDADFIGEAPGGGGQYANHDPYTGRVESVNQDVLDGMLDRAENRATPNELSESYPTNTNFSTPSNWPTFENIQQQPYQNQPWSWEQWNNYFR